MIREILGVRLFGYGVPYRARFERGVVEPARDRSRNRGRDLAQALARLRGAPGTPGSDAWALSMPFGRCGLNGLPREHLRVFAARKAWLDLLTWDGPQEVAVPRDSWSPSNRRASCACAHGRNRGDGFWSRFRRQDRTPLMGNAAPFTLDGEVPERWDERLGKGHAAFAEAAGLWSGDRPAYEAALERFFGSMAEKLEGDAAVAAVCEEARGAGSYDAPDEGPFFDYQEGMLDEPLLARIRAQDPELFRFPRDVRRHRDVVQLSGVRALPEDVPVLLAHWFEHQLRHHDLPGFALRVVLVLRLRCFAVPTYDSEDVGGAVPRPRWEFEAFCKTPDRRT